MHFQDLVIILGFNLIVISVFFTVQKKAIAKTIKNLKNEIQDLEDLVAAIIEEFEEIAVSPEDVIENKGEVNRALGEVEIDLNLNSNFADDLAAGMELADSENDLESVPYKADEGFRQSTAAGEGDGLFNPVEIVEEEAMDNGGIDSAATEYSSGDGFGLFKATPDQIRKTGEKAETVLNSEFINDPKHRRIFELWKQGLTVEEIARQLSTGRGEIQLIVGIYRRG